MIDRLEELLSLMAAEDEDDGREDAPALAEKTVPAAPPREEGAAAGAGDDGVETGRAAVESLTENGRAWEDAPEAELAWPVGGFVRAAEAAVRRQAAETPGQAEELSAAGWGAGYGGEPGLSLAAADGQEAAGGLERLYRQTVQAARPAAPALAAEPSGRSVRAEEAGSAASLAVDELDRAVRRDSRRYDGGMSIY